MFVTPAKTSKEDLYEVELLPGDLAQRRQSELDSECKASWRFIAQEQVGAEDGKLLRGSIRSTGIFTGSTQQDSAKTEQDGQGQSPRPKRGLR